MPQRMLSAALHEGSTGSAGLFRRDAGGVQWRVSPGLTPYRFAVGMMEGRVAAIAAGQAGEQVWLVEHPPLYTAGASAREQDLLQPHRLPVHHTRRGGQYTYHGPGQRVVYLMLDLNVRGRDVRAFVAGLQAWLIAALGELGVRGETDAAGTGVWVRTADGSRAKIAAVGVRLRRWVSYHGVSINLDPDLSHYEGIVPCGVREYGVTSLAGLGRPTGMAEFDEALRRQFVAYFGPVVGWDADSEEVPIRLSGQAI